ncbi:MAG: hypothetical protein ACXVJD_04750 [Mucilaginibacter sp.]
MSFKSFYQTRWVLEPNRVTVFPYRLFYFLAIVLAVIFAGILLVFTKLTYAGLADDSSFAFILLLVVVLFGGFGGTCVEFDNGQAVMRKKLMGFIPIAVTPFNKLQGINVVTNAATGYNYRMFRKDARYGKGTVVSARYGRNDDPNAIAFVNEVIPVVHSYLRQHDDQSAVAAAPLTDYRHFTQDNGSFTVKKNKVAAAILGLLMFTVGVHEFTPGAWMHDVSLFGSVCIFIFFVIGGPVIIIAGFTTVTFDPAAKTISRKSPVGFGNKTWSFQDFAGLNTIRRSVNLIYSGTDVQMNFQRTGNKPEAIIVRTFRTSRSIERFVQELHQIMGIS